MPRPKLRTAALRAEVLDTTRQLLEDEGPAACTTRRIAHLAGTSPPALYELFGDKGGLLREVFFEGFRMLGDTFGRLPTTDAPREDLEAVARAFRAFAQANPELISLMFSRSFATFVPDPEERQAGELVRRFLLGRVKRCLDAGVIAGNPTDIAHNLLGLAIGLATQEQAGWLGTSAASIARRWELGVRALITGLAPARRA